MADANNKQDRPPVETEFPLLKEDSVASTPPTRDNRQTQSLPADSRETVEAKAQGATPVAPTQQPKYADGASRATRFAETPAMVIELPKRSLTRISRRDFLIYGLGAAAVAGGFWWLLPDDTQGRLLSDKQRTALDSLQARAGLTTGRKERFLGRVLTFDDDVAEALYSPNRLVPTYGKRDITPNLRNNYDGQTPDPDYIPDWTLTVKGLASGKTQVLTMKNLLGHFGHQDEITRLCCVEGWSAIAWWGGLRFADFLKAYPPAPDMRWAKIESSVNLDDQGNSDPYYVSIDLPTAMHPQTLLATHHSGKPLDVDHGAPLRLIAPMKLGLKNIKAITAITYTRTEPADYWNDRGYSKYDGV